MSSYEGTIYKNTKLLGWSNLGVHPENKVVVHAGNINNRHPQGECPASGLNIKKLSGIEMELECLEFQSCEQRLQSTVCLVWKTWGNEQYLLFFIKCGL